MAESKDRQALELRRAGVPIDTIADKLDYPTRRHVKRAVARGLANSLAEDTDVARQLEADRLDRMLVAVWPEAAKGVTDAIDRVLRIGERRAKLLGLDADTKVPPLPKPSLIWESDDEDDDGRSRTSA